LYISAVLFTREAAEAPRYVFPRHVYIQENCLVARSIEILILAMVFLLVAVLASWLLLNAFAFSTATQRSQLVVKHAETSSNQLKLVAENQGPHAVEITTIEIA
jgi:hypothetical protein